MSNILNLTLKKEWFDEIASGHKKEEFREVKQHWISRFASAGTVASFDLDDVVKFIPREFDYIHFKNGYAKDAPLIIAECLDIEFQNDIECPLGKGDFFVIKIGKILEVKK